MVPRRHAAAAALALGAIAAAFCRSRPSSLSLAMATSTGLARPAPPAEVSPMTRGQTPREVTPNSFMVETSKQQLTKGIVLSNSDAQHIGIMKRRRLEALAAKGQRAVLVTTRREQNLRRMLNDGLEPPQEEFDRMIQVFAKRSSQVLKYDFLVRVRQVHRAKIWANEMLLQGRMPSRTTVRVLLRGLAATAEIPAAKRWIRWARKNYNLGLAEWNYYIQAYGEAGRPNEIYSIMKKMQNSSIQPDHRSYAGLMKAFELLGNREMMLRTLVDMQQKEEEGTLGQSLDPLDAARPYYALARSYMRVGDAIRAMSILKFVKDTGLPLSTEAYLIRLEVLLRIPEGPRRSLEQAKKALADAIRHNTPGEMLLSRQMAGRCRRVLRENFEEVLRDEGVLLEDLVTSEPPRHRKLIQYSIARAYKKKTTGLRLILSQENEDLELYKSMKRRRADYELQDTESGIKRRVKSKRDLPEWMSLKRPIVYGLGMQDQQPLKQRSIERIMTNGGIPGRF